MVIRTLGLGAAFALLMCASAAAAPVTVTVQVEGVNGTIFEGPVSTDVHPVDGGDGSGSHTCDGTNAGANPSPGPTFMGALDDAARQHGFTWFGTFGDFGIPDFFVRRIGAESDSSSTFWYQLRNYRANQVGACQQQVQQGDLVEWALSGFDSSFNPQPVLQLSGTPAIVQTGQAFNVQVQQHDGNGNATPAAGASVGGQTTGSDGQASVSFASAGVQRFKATKTGAIRSNAQEVCVEDAGSGTCSGFKPTVEAAPEPDHTDPVASVTGLRSGKHYHRGPRTLKGKASDGGTGVRDVRLRLNWIARKGCRFFDGKLERFTKPGTCKGARFFSLGDNGKWSYLLPDRLAPGRYSLTVKVVDKADNVDVERVRFAVTG